MQPSPAKSLASDGSYVKSFAILSVEKQDQTMMQELAQEGPAAFSAQELPAHQDGGEQLSSPSPVFDFGLRTPAMAFPTDHNLTTEELEAELVRLSAEESMQRRQSKGRGDIMRNSTSDQNDHPLESRGQYVADLRDKKRHDNLKAKRSIGLDKPKK